MSNKPSTEQTAQEMRDAVLAIGQDTSAVNVTNVAKGGDKVLIGTVGLVPGSGTPWFDRSPFFRVDSEAIALEIDCESNATGDLSGVDFDFCLFVAIGGQEGDTYPVNDTQFLYSERWRPTDTALSADVQDRFVKMLPTVPGALYRLGAKFLPGAATVTTASFEVYASGVTVS